MTLTKKSRDGKCLFIEEPHEYWIGEEKMTSVTQLLKKYFEPFDTNKIAKLKADKTKRINYQKYKKGEPLTEQDKKEATQKYWKQLWKEAASHGTRVHEALENHINKVEGNNLQEERDYKKYEQGKKALEWIFKNHFKTKKVTHHTEELIYNEDLQIAGQIDLMSTVDDNIYLLDYKTSKKISMEGYKGKKGIHPITMNLESCEYIKYSLQLGIYKKMLQLAGKKINECYIIHLKEDDFEIYETKELEEEIISIFSERLEEVESQKVSNLNSYIGEEPKDLNSSGTLIKTGKQ